MISSPFSRSLAETVSSIVLCSGLLGPALLAADASSVPYDIPPSWVLPGLASIEDVPVHDMPAVDVAALRAEDAARDADRFDKPMRVGQPMRTDLDPSRVGLWESAGPAGDVWRLRVRSNDALWVVLGFGTFRPTGGTRMYVYDQAGTRVQGPFSSADVREHGQLWMPPIAGDTVVVELYRPRAEDGVVPDIHLGTVSHGYEPWGGIGVPKDDPGIDSGSCNVDLACPLGADWQDEKRGVVNMLSGGSGYCTGSLITNTAGDCANYVLTANHCLSSQSSAAATSFQFNFERPACGSGIAPTDQIVTGSTLRATYSPSDMTLLEIDDEIPEAFAPFYNGWSHDRVNGTESWGIHHPNNDEKAISFNQDPLVDGLNYGPDHWRINQWEQGTTEPGSSGSPLFDQNHRIVGQLHGGTASCTSLTWDEYGKVAVSWDGGGAPASALAPWLDPVNSGAVVLDGIDGAVCRIPQPRFVYAGSVADDTAGNGDGVVDPGESIVIAVDLENGGTLDGTAIAGVLSSSTVGVIIVDDAADWPDIPTAAVRTSDAPHFTVDLDASVVCGTVLSFLVDVVPAEDPGAGRVAFEVPTGTASVETRSSDDMESGPNGFAVELLEGTNGWNLSTADAFSPTHAWFVQDIPTRSDTALVMPTLTALPANAVLRFRHRYNTEVGWDGGVLEYTIDGASWTDAGALVTVGAYSGSISVSAASNLAGRAAWLGDSGDWRAVEVDLAPLAGEDVGFRWRFATDTSVRDEGWYVDDVVVDVTSYACNDPVLQAPGEVSASAAGKSGAFTIDQDPEGYRLRWSPPVSGGPVDEYVLYATALSGAGVTAPVCETGLGGGIEAVVANLTVDRGFLVVGRNAAGEGSYGTDRDGVERPGASGTDACP